MKARALLAGALALLLLQGCMSAPDETSGPATNETSLSDSAVMPTPTPTRDPLPRVAKKLAAPPTDCEGPAPNPQPVVRHYGSLEGEKPIWGGIYAGYRPEHQAFYASDARRTKHGFRIKVLWIIHPRHRTPVTIEGRDLDTGAPIYFDVEASGSPVASAHLDPGSPGTVPQSNWKEYPSYVFFSGAGCYELRATWSSGSWRTIFGFGRR